MRNDMKNLKTRIKGFGYDVSVRADKLSATLPNSNHVFIVKNLNRPSFYSLSQSDYNLWAQHGSEGYIIFQCMSLPELLKYLHDNAVCK